MYIGTKARGNASICLNATEIKCNAAKWRYLRDVSLMSIPVTLTRALLDRLGGTLALMNGPHQRMTQSRPSGSWYGTHGPRITNWGPNRGRPAPWHIVIYIDPSLCESFSFSIPSWICERLIARLVSGISNLQQRNTLLHRQRFSWSLGYVPWIRKIIERESVYWENKDQQEDSERKHEGSKYIYEHIRDNIYYIELIKHSKNDYARKNK